MSEKTVTPIALGMQQTERLEGLATMANYQRSHPRADFSRAESIDWNRRWTWVVQTLVAARYLLTLANSSPQQFALRTAAWELLQQAKQQAGEIHGRYPVVVSLRKAG